MKHHLNHIKSSTCAKNQRILPYFRNGHQTFYLYLGPFLTILIWSCRQKAVLLHLEMILVTQINDYMKYTEFEDIISPDRMRKYIMACNNDSKRAMTLYRYNLKLSQEMFTMISCFEVALRNRIDREMKLHYGNDWLRDFIMPGGPFYSDPRVEGTKKIIMKSYDGLMRANLYSHPKLLSEMEFGVWKYMFNNVQYRLGGRHLLQIFPNKPKSNKSYRVDNSKIFFELDCINNIRNRIAHHEPICFGRPVCIDTTYALNNYARMMTLFQWMGIDANRFLYGLDHVGSECSKIMCV